MSEPHPTGTTPVDTTGISVTSAPEETAMSTVADPFADLNLEAEPFPEPNLPPTVKHPKDTDWEVEISNNPEPVITEPETVDEAYLPLVIEQADELPDNTAVNVPVDSAPVADVTPVADAVDVPSETETPAYAPFATTSTGEPDLTGLDLPWLVNEGEEEPWWMNVSEYGKAGTIIVVLSLAGAGLLGLLYAFGQAVANGAV